MDIQEDEIKMGIIDYIKEFIHLRSIIKSMSSDENEHYLRIGSA